MISVQSIAKSFGNRTLWSDVSFTVNQGEMVALVGPSGSGKSTLLNCLGLLEKVDTGRVVVGGRDVTSLGKRAQRIFRRDSLGYLFQNYALIDNADVDLNIRIALGGVRDSRQWTERLEAALNAVGLEGRGKEMAYRLSGGEQQRLALARLLIKEPSVVLADEPTGALDSDNADMVISVLRNMAANGCAVVVATHSKDVESNCDKTITVGSAAP